MYVSVNDLTQLDQLTANAGIYIRFPTLFDLIIPILSSLVDLRAVKQCLKDRYLEKSLYTWAGPTLVALNPLQELAHLYSRDVIQHFNHHAASSLLPHIFAIGQRALRHLQWSLGKVNQAVVVNGESGAGKVIHHHLHPTLESLLSNKPDSI